MKHDLFHRITRYQKSPWQIRNRLLIFSGKSWFGGSLFDKQLAFNGTLLEANNKIQQSSHLGHHAMLCRDDLPLNVNRNLRKIVYVKLEKYSTDRRRLFSIDLSFYETNLQSSLHSRYIIDITNRCAKIYFQRSKGPVENCDWFAWRTIFI